MSKADKFARIVVGYLLGVNLAGACVISAYMISMITNPVVAAVVALAVYSNIAATVFMVGSWLLTKFAQADCAPVKE